MPRPANPKPRYLAYGGDHQKSRSGRRARPVMVNYSMHVTLRSSRARGVWSFRNPRNLEPVRGILERFAARNGITLHKLAIHFNHIHMRVRFPSRKAYMKFIRAISAAIAMHVAGMNRWTKMRIKFWDRRPFSRPALDKAAEERVDNYIAVNEFETLGLERAVARFIYSKIKECIPRAGPRRA